MGMIIAIMAVPWLSLTGIHNPPVMRHGHALPSQAALTRFTVRRLQLLAARSIAHGKAR